MLSKTQAKIMQLFTSQITKQFRMITLCKTLDMHDYAIMRAIRPIISKKLINFDAENKLYSLNYKQNHQELAYIEHLRNEAFFKKPKNKMLSLFVDEVIKKLKGYFVLLLFGSAVIKSNPRDIDILLIIEKTEDIEKAERALNVIASNYTLKLEIVVISFESVYEQLGLRDNQNVMNEVLNKHMILYGGELFYKLLKEGRK